MSQHPPNPAPAPGSPFAKPEGVTLGIGLTTPSPELAQICGNSGFDFVMIDMEHGPADFETAYRMVTALAGTPADAWIRVATNDAALIKRALDTGATNVVVPMVNTREEAEQAVAACLYPPRGTRSVGGSVHAMNFATDANDYYAHIDDEVLIVLQCEHIQAVEDADKIFSVPGIDAIFVGPNDLAASMRGKDGRPPSGEATAQATKHILATCKKYKVAPGVHCGSAEEANARIAEGWQFLAVGSELKMMLNGVSQVIQKLGAARGGADLAKY